MQKTRSRTKGAIAVVFSLWLGMGMAASVSADTAFQGEKWTDSIKFNGDMRIRHDASYNKSAGNRDRNRERFRLRFGVTASMQDFLVGMRFASGTGEQTSTNQTETGLFNQKGLLIDQAYVQWKAHEYVKLMGGRMPNPLWRTYASDIVWDDDVNPEGYAQSFDMPAGDRLGVFANFGQFPLSEAQNMADPWMFANQIGSRIKVTEDTRISLAGTYYGFTNEKAGAFVAGAPFPGVQQAGNTRVSTTSSQLATSMKLLHFTGELAGHLMVLPLSLQGDYVTNMDDTPARGRNGYQTGVIVGKAKNANSWEVAYFYKYSQVNCTVADLADSDFGGGGTNRKGHIMWISYAPRDYVTIRGKYFITDVLNPYLNSSGIPVTTPAFNSINRFQLDLQVKF